MFSLVFPGQGSQTIGMGKDFFENYNLVRDLFSQADDSLGINLSKIISSVSPLTFIGLKKRNKAANNKVNSLFNILIDWTYLP